MFHLEEGWFFVASGRVYGTFADQASAERELEQQQQAEWDLSKKHRGYK